MPDSREVRLVVLNTSPPEGRQHVVNRHRYLFAIAAVAVAFALRLGFIRLTGTGAPFALFFAAIMVTGLSAGVGPALFALLLSLPIGTYAFVLRAGYPLSHAVVHSLLFLVEGLVAVCLTFLMRQGREAVQNVNRQLRRANEEVSRAEARSRELLGRERLIRQQEESVLEQLRESEERFRLTIDEAPIGMARVSLDGRFVRVNRALCEIVGYSPEELTALTFQAITHPDDLHADVAAAERLERGEIPRYQVEKRYIRKDGEIVDVQLSVSILRSQNGAPRYYISQIEDITERKRAEKALRLSEAKFSAIISIAADAIISVDENQQITIFNEGAERIFGYARAEVVGKPLEMLIPERFRAVHREHFTRFATGHDEVARPITQRQDVFGLRRNGAEFPAEASISKVGVGGVSLFSVVLRDITERKSTEEALRQAVTERDRVLGIVAHDLRNPLTTIVQSVTLAQRIPEPERLNKRLDIISRAATRMDQLIQGLLDVSMIEAGQLKIEGERVRTADLVLEAVDLQRPLASSSGLEIRVDVARGVDDLWASRERLHEVFENLIGNAIKFTAAGGHITVGATSRGNDVLFWVADTGCGMARDDLAHVFERFWQAVPRGGHLGAGLGLTITKGIVEAHGGRIWAESTAGLGSTFFFTIPKAPTDGHHSKHAVHELTA
jgi:PAS domain S-box-containing protein